VQAVLNLRSAAVEGGRSTGALVPRSLLSRLREQVERQPNAIAVMDEVQELTFADLDHRSNDLAAVLQSQGVGVEDCVGLLFERSVDFVVAAVAVWKCGAAYLPLDPGTPAERGGFILRDAGAKVLLSHRNKAKTWAGDWKSIEIDQAPTGGKVGSSIVIGDVSEENLAYIIYTSGSTGAPKGVEITHANLLNLIDWHQEAFGVTGEDRASQVAGFGFDATVWEIWPHLTAGASLHIASEETRRSPQALRDWLVAQRITIAFVPTVLAEPLLQAAWPADTALRTMLTGADVLHRRPIEGLPFAFVNNYGPSECAVVATSGVIAPSQAGETTTNDLPSIGRPIRNTTVLILDENLKQVSNGEAGELCLGGALVGRGYRNQPELTASRYVTLPSEGGESLRIYRTGDRAVERSISWGDSISRSRFVVIVSSRERLWLGSIDTRGLKRAR
jgi:amino acid adenylation domain-containing protein